MTSESSVIDDCLVYVDKLMNKKKAKEKVENDGTTYVFWEKQLGEWPLKYQNFVVIYTHFYHDVLIVERDVQTRA